MIRIQRTFQYAKWLAGLADERAKARIQSRLLRLANGNFGDVRPVGEGVSELRVHYGPGYRVYFTQQGNALVILLIGGDKSTQQKDIERAKVIAKNL